MANVFGLAFGYANTFYTLYYETWYTPKTLSFLGKTARSLTNSASMLMELSLTARKQWA